MANLNRESPPKRRRLDDDYNRRQHAHDFLPKTAMDTRDKDDCEQTSLASKYGKDGSSAIASNSKHATQAVASFLSEHIPQQYGPQGNSHAMPMPPSRDPSTRYCYRHRPDLKCRRTVDEEGMDQLQQACLPNPLTALSSANAPPAGA